MIFFIVNDLVLIPLSVYLAFFLRFEGQIPLQYSGTIQAFIILAIVFLVPIFYSSKLYSFSWSYVSAEELISLMKSVVLGFSFLATTLFIFRNYSTISGFPRSTLVISFFLVILFCGGIRFSKRLYLQMFKKIEGKERTLIVGAGDAGEQILRSIQGSKAHFRPVGFVDDNIVKQGVLIHGLKVLGKIEEIPRIIRDNNIDGMIIALPSAGSEVIKRAIEKGREAGLRKIKVIPSLVEIANGQVSVADLKELRVEDLLGRKPVSLNIASIEKLIKDKNILITGAAGSIGSELCRQIARFKPSLIILLDQDETGIFNISEELKSSFPYLKLSSEICNIQDKEKVFHLFRELKPSIIFHAAAYKHVPLMEKHPDEAVKNNIFGTKTVAEAALNCGAEKFIFISTDKAVRPSSVMGATKRAGEMLCKSFNKKDLVKFMSVRFGNVLDSRGSVIPIFKDQIKKGGPVEVTHPDMERYFMMISEACLLVMQAAEMGKGGEVFVLDMGEPVKILDLAKELIRLSGLEPDKDIPIVFTQPRPGEKLFEEILTSEEGTVATQQKKIFIARLSGVDEEVLETGVNRLKEALKEKNEEKIKDILKEIIPSYNPSSF